MNTIHLDSWEKFEEIASGIHSRKFSKSPLYRGQRCGNWRLETTLERHGCKEYLVQQYIVDMRKAALAVETATGKRWSLEPATDGHWARHDDIHVTPTGYAFMAFLRQNGFPCPLLDWSRSPYVAAFFAFHGAKPEKDACVAIFQYVESADGSRAGTSSQAHIHPLGPWIGTDRKHFLQQSEYTVCRKDGTIPGIPGLLYASHEEAFDRGSVTQDVLTKYLIPSTERNRVMERLRLMNITRYSLFESMEGLMEVVASDVIGHSRD